jgi:hypothetical protein
MSKLAQAGDSSTASPGCASTWARRTASSMSPALSIAPSPAVEPIAFSISGPSRPISTAARAWRATALRSGEKSCPLPSPPRITTIFRSF